MTVLCLLHPEIQDTDIKDKGEVHLNVINASNDWNTISPGTKLAQALMLQVGTFVPMCVEEDELYAAHPAVGDRGAGGFGSSGG